MYQQLTKRLQPNPSPQLPATLCTCPLLIEQLQVVSIDRRSPLMLQASKQPRYLMPLSNNLFVLQGVDGQFGLHLPKGLLWPSSKLIELQCNGQGLVGLLDAPAMRELLLISAETRNMLLQAIGHSLHYISAELEHYACSSLSSRVARLLLALGATSDDGTILYAHSQLARLVNAQRESVSLIIGRFRRAGWISTSYGRIQLCDRQALQLLTDEY